MAWQRSDGAATRRRLLEAAGRLFASKGYHDTHTADICSEAGANSAAVNYYFGGKEDLYVESWRHAFKQSLERCPAGGGVAASAPPEERLRARLRALIERIVDPSNIEFDIAHRESVNPTGLLAEAMERSVGPLRERMHALVRELLGADASPTVVRLCEMSVVAQCFGLLHERRRRDTLRGRQLPSPSLCEMNVDDLVDHILAFSLAGIRGVKGRGGRAVRRVRRRARSR